MAAFLRPWTRDSQADRQEHSSGPLCALWQERQRVWLPEVRQVGAGGAAYGANEMRVVGRIRVSWWRPRCELFDPSTVRRIITPPWWAPRNPDNSWRVEQCSVERGLRALPPFHCSTNHHTSSSRKGRRSGLERSKGWRDGSQGRRLTRIAEVAGPW
jgi:hypothetical protein